MKYKLVIFDWQGTLTDVVGQFVKQFNEVAVSLGLPLTQHKQLSSMINQDICTIVQTLFPKAENYTKRMRMVECFKVYRMHHGHDVCLHSGVVSMLQNLHQQGVFISIATAASQNTLKAELAYSGVGPLIDAYKTPDHTLCKPAPDMLNELMDELGCAKEETVMIGDSRCDFEAALHANVNFIGIHMSNKELISEILNSSNLMANDINTLFSCLDS